MLLDPLPGEEEEWEPRAELLDERPLERFVLLTRELPELRVLVDLFEVAMVFKTVGYVSFYGNFGAWVSEYAVMPLAMA